MNKGMVYLVGAGPGDPKLLTLKAAELIKNSEVIVYDRLVSPAIMELANTDALLIDVGKNAGNHPVPQDKINEILKQQAEEGKTVVRLKGGDPFVFGRGGEELELLAANNISFCVVPGITSSVSVPAYAGIPVTHRNFCSSVHIITGHAKADSELSLDFDALVRLKGTLVFMMSVSSIGKIAEGLMAACMDKSMPCAVIENGTYSNQRKFIATLETICETVKQNNVKSPAVIIVGKVCSLSSQFDWFSSLPLINTKILLTQPRKNQSAMADKLRSLGADVALYPCIKTEFMHPNELDMSSYTALVFTSAVGVQSFFEYLSQAGCDSRCLYGKKIACVGSKTADELTKHGITADFIPTVFDGKHLAQEMADSDFVSNKDKLLILRALDGSPDLCTILAENKIPYTDLPVYKTSYIKNEGINPEDFDFIAFTSKSCVEGFAGSTGISDFSGISSICIGEQTAKAATEYGFLVNVAEKCTTDSMIDLMIKLKGGRYTC